MGFSMQSQTTKISFQFLPYQQESNLHAVERVEKGAKDGKRRYLVGVSSGLAVDGHGERMSQGAIDGFVRQAEEGEILLYPDTHGIRATEDVGKLIKAEVLENGDWLTEYMLYDGTEGAQDNQVQKANTLWAQVNGLPPYKKARQKGFSIEGWIPDGGFNFDGKGRRVINSVELDGVVVVPKPAYGTSIASAVYKALGEKTPQELKKSLASKFSELVGEREQEREYYETQWDFRCALDECIKEVMENTEIDNASRRQYLEDVFNDFKAGMIDLILRSASIFQDESSDNGEVALSRSLLDDGVPVKEKIYRSLSEQLLRLHKTLKEKFHGKARR